MESEPPLVAGDARRIHAVRTELADHVGEIVRSAQWAAVSALRRVSAGYFLMWSVDFSFSLQMNSIISWSTMIRWLTRTVNGFV